MTETVRIKLEGVNPSTVHIHLTTDTTAVLAALTELRDTMSNLGDSVAALSAAQQAAFARVTEDVDHLRQLVEDALANDGEDAATIAALRAEADAAVASIATVTDALTGLDPDASFPATEPTP